MDGPLYTKCTPDQLALPKDDQDKKCFDPPANCPKVQERINIDQLVEQNADAISLALKTMKQEPCVTNNSTVGGVSIFGVVGGVNAYSRGCEKVANQSSIIANSQQAISCIINNATVSDNTRVNVELSMKNIVITNNKIKGDLIISQDAKVNVTMASSLSNEVKSQIENVLSAMVENVLKASQTSETEPSGQLDGVISNNSAISAGNTVTAANQNNNAVTEVHRKFLTALSMENFTISGNEIGGDLKLAQSAVFTLYAQTQINATIESMLKNSTIVQYINQLDTAQKAVAKGWQLGFGLGGGFVLLLVIGLIVYAVMKMRLSFMTHLRYILPLLCVGFIVAALVFGLVVIDYIATIICGLLAVLFAAAAIYVLVQHRRMSRASEQYSAQSEMLEDTKQDERTDIVDDNSGVEPSGDDNSVVEPSGKPSGDDKAEEEKS